MRTGGGRVRSYKRLKELRTEAGLRDLTQDQFSVCRLRDRQSETLTRDQLLNSLLCRHAMGTVLSAGPSVIIPVAASMRAHGVLLLLRRARAAAGVDPGGHAQDGGLLLG